MESLEKSYWFEVTNLLQITCFRNEDPGGEDQVQSPGGDEPISTTDPDFEQVSAFILGSGNPDPEESASPVPLITATPTVSASPAASSAPSESATSGETEVYTSDITDRLDNLIVQVGVIDICLVLSLLISIIKNFIRVPR